jgi:tetratricopeptide (TPR) repeat protein
MRNNNSAVEEAKAQARAAAHAGELGRRLKAAGAMVGELTCSLMWDNEDDLDLHCETPTGSHIFWNAKVGSCGGHLDVDMNASDKHLTCEGVENLYWPKPPAGHYKIWVENNQDRTDGPTAFTVRLTKDGQVEEKTFTDLEEYDEQLCFEFDYEPVDTYPSVQKQAKLAQMLEHDAEALAAGHLTLRLNQEVIESAGQMYDRAKALRVIATQVGSLQRQGQMEMDSGKFEQATETARKALELAKANSIDTSSIEKLIAQIKQRGSENARSRVAVDASDHARCEAAGTAAATKIFEDLDLSQAGTLNYRRFISWWQKAIKVHHSNARITDEELQQTMEIWGEFDAEGQGVTAAGLGGVVTGMMRAGIIRMTVDGHVVPLHTAHVQRKRGTTGLAGASGHVTGAEVHSHIEVRTHSGRAIIGEEEAIIEEESGLLVDSEALRP